MNAAQLDNLLVEQYSVFNFSTFRSLLDLYRFLAAYGSREIHI